MTKIIQLENHWDCEHLLGKFLDESHYDFVINEDVDVYRPLKLGETQNENTILLKFRKGVLPQDQCRTAFAGLYSGAISTDNRGLAAGDRGSEYQQLPGGGAGARRWVTKREKAVLEYFAVGSPKNIFGEDQAQEIYDTFSPEPLEGRGAVSGIRGENELGIKGGAIWIVKLAHEVSFPNWFAETVKLSPEERREAAKALTSRYISETSYGEAVLSGTGGSMDRYPRIPFCRQTAWTAANPEKFSMAIPMMETASRVFAENLPSRWKGQYDCASRLDPHFRIGETVYSTVTINRSFRTACHRDAGDLCEDGVHQPLPRGFSNLTVLSNGKAFDGFYLCFPEYRVAVNIQDGDLIMMDAHKIHGNTPLISCEEGFERLSVVLYFREEMLSCGSRAYEELRKKFVYERKANSEHPEWKPKWNGISPGMWDSEEWANYMLLHQFEKEGEHHVSHNSIGESALSH